MKFALRQLLKSPGFTVVAVLTLALGIGVNSAMFSVVDAILLRPLPYSDPDGLVRFFENHVENGWRQNAIGAPVIGEWRKHSTMFEGIAGYDGQRFVLTGRDQPVILPGASISANTFSLLGIKPVLGRDFLAEEESYGKHHVALLSSETWKKRFGADPGVVGRDITLDGESFEIIGVMPARMQHPDPGVEIWTPLAFSPSKLRQRHNHHYSAFGRLKPGVSVAAAQTEMNLIASRMAAVDPENQGWGAEVYPMREIAVRNSRPLLFTLLAFVGFVLLIACANIANLLLARSSARAREFAIRTALGAGRTRIILQLLSESLVLALAGGIAGVLLAQAGLALMLRFSPPDLPRISEGVHLDGRALAFTTGISLLAGLLFGLAPAWLTSRQTLGRDLNDTSRGNSAGGFGRRLRSVFVVSQVAISLTLLIGAGLMIRSFGRLLSQDLGYQAENLINIPFSLPDKTYPGRAAKRHFFEQLYERAASIPGVEAAALVYGLPLGFEDSDISVEIPGAPTPRPGESVSAGYSQISPGYFRTVGIPLLQGREFNSQDRTNTTPVLIVDESFARKFKLGSNPIGRLVSVGDGTKNAEIVGLVRDVKRRDMAAAPRGEMYRPYLQNCWGYMNLTLRTRLGLAEINRAVRAEVDQLDKNIPIENVRTFVQLVDSAVSQQRLSAQLLGCFAGISLLLTVIGLYGVLAYSVGQRSKEIGVRIALGAQKLDVMSMILLEGMILIGIGLAAGLCAAFALTRLLRGLLFGVTTTDPLTYLVVPCSLLIVGLLACWLPACRATKVDPMEALRES